MSALALASTVRFTKLYAAEDVEISLERYQGLVS